MSYLYVQVVEGGTFRPADEADHYDLELRHAGGTTLAFADRPARSVRLLPTDEALASIGFTPDAAQRRPGDRAGGRRGRGGGGTAGGALRRRERGR